MSNREPTHRTIQKNIKNRIKNDKVKTLVKVKPRSDDIKQCKISVENTNKIVRKSGENFKRKVLVTAHNIQPRNTRPESKAKPNKSLNQAVHPDNDDSEVILEGWKKMDIIELLSRIDELLPAEDKLRYDSRVETLDWERIKFSSYTAQECKDKWKVIQRKLRRHRSLKELLVDAKCWLDQPWIYLNQPNSKEAEQGSTAHMSSFTLYFLERKERLTKKYPEMPLQEMTKRLAKKYKHLPFERKEKYKKLAAALREVLAKN